MYGVVGKGPSGKVIFEKGSEESEQVSLAGVRTGGEEPRHNCASYTSTETCFWSSKDFGEDVVPVSKVTWNL